MQRFKGLVVRPAEVTVFLTLICLVFCAFIGTLIKSCQHTLVRQKIEAVTDIAIRSAFSEYDKSLFDDYGLLYVDTTYRGTESGGVDSLCNHISEYIEANLNTDDSHNLSISLISINVNDVEYADINELTRALSEHIRERGELSESTEEEIVSSFEVDTLIEGVDMTACFEGADGRLYECRKQFGLQNDY